jgi:hypothetical protein
MISAKQIHDIEDHCDTIADNVWRRLQGTTLMYAHPVPDWLVRQRVRDLVGHLGDWLDGRDIHSLTERYEKFGAERAAERIPLHELVRVVQMIRLTAADYSREHNWADQPFASQAESDLEYRLAAFFDLVTYSLVKGYEEAAYRVLPQRR